MRLTVGIHYQGSVQAIDALAAGDQGEVVAAKLVADANANERLGVAGVDIAVVGQDVDARIYAGGVVVGAAGFDGDHVHPEGVGIVVATLDGDGQGGAAGGAGQVADGVGEGIAQRIARDAQGLHARVVVVDEVDVAAVGVEGQGAVLAGQGAANAADIGAVADSDHSERFAELVDVGVVGQDVAARVDAREVVVEAARLDGDGVVVVGHRRVVGALDGDVQHRDIGGATGVGVAVVEAVDQGVAGAQGLHRRHAVVQTIAVAAVGVERQPAVGAAQFAAEHAGRA